MSDPVPDTIIIIIIIIIIITALQSPGHPDQPHAVRVGAQLAAQGRGDHHLQVAVETSRIPAHNTAAVRCTVLYCTVLYCTVLYCDLW